MAGHKDTPRQKMISMMYLVLTALLALNVSKEVLSAFVIVNEGIVRTNLTFSRKIDDTYKKFEKNYQLNQTEVFPFWVKAQEAQKLSKDLIEYLDNLRAELIAHTESIEIDSARIVEFKDLNKMDDNIKPTGFFMGPSETGKDGKAGEMKEKISTYRKKMLELVDPKHWELLLEGLNPELEFFDSEGKRESWEVHHFYDTILAADITILNKLITEVYNAEFDILNILMVSISEEDFKYDKIAAKILPNSNYILKGEEFEAEVIVAAYDTTQSPEVFLMAGVDSLPPDQIGKARQIFSDPGKIQIKLPGQREGTNKYAGLIQVKNGSGGNSTYHFSGSYIVAQPGLTVSATKMNVFYVGVDNSVSISVAGIPKEKLQARISCGSLIQGKDNNDWVARVPANCKEATISVDALLDGVKKTIGSETFRVKQLPNPSAVIANQNGGFIDREVILRAGSIIPKMPEDFEFEFQFKIESFQLNLQRGFNQLQFKSANEKLTDEMRQEIRRTNRGQVLVFDNIIALGPDRSPRNLPPIILTIE